MSGYFADKLPDLLPPIYRERDTAGDLRAFLTIPAETLDEIKSLIDRLPDIWNVDTCDPRFLPLVSAIVGYSFDPTRDPDTQRREIAEIVEQYRRKGSIPAIGHSLINVGWEGEIDETFRSALRLNKRSCTNASKLPGRIYSLGVYRIICENITSGLRDALREHSPAGTKVFYIQWMRSDESMPTDGFGSIGRIVTLPSDVRPREAFVVGHDHLNSKRPLNLRRSSWSYWRITEQVTVRQDFVSAGMLINRWHGRTTRGKLNSISLNTARLLGVEIDERRLSMTCPVAVDPSELIAPPYVRLTRQHLNRSKLALGRRLCQVRFKRKDYYTLAEPVLEAATNLYVVTRWPGSQEA